MVSHQYTLTKNEILTGIYEYRLPTGKHNYKLVDFTLVKVKQPVKHAPNICSSLRFIQIKVPIKR